MARKTKPAALFELMALSRKGVSPEDARRAEALLANSREDGTESVRETK